VGRTGKRGSIRKINQIESREDEVLVTLGFGFGFFALTLNLMTSFKLFHDPSPLEVFFQHIANTLTKLFELKHFKAVCSNSLFGRPINGDY
jgi:hypothetical protein